MKQTIFKKEVLPAIIATILSLAVFKICGLIVDNIIDNDFVVGLINQIIFAIATLVSVHVLKKTKIFQFDIKDLKAGWPSALLLIVFISFIAYMCVEEGIQITVPIWEVLVFITQMLLVGFCEEVLYRGLIQNAWHAFFKEDTRLHVFLAILCTGITFGLSHLTNGFDPAIGFAAAFNQALATSFMGMYFGVIYFRTGKNIWFLIILHALYDFVLSITNGRLSGVNMEDLLASAQTIKLSSIFIQGAVIMFAIALALYSKRTDALLKKDSPETTIL